MKLRSHLLAQRAPCAARQLSPTPFKWSSAHDIPTPDVHSQNNTRQRAPRRSCSSPAAGNVISPAQRRFKIVIVRPKPSLT